MRSAGLFTPVKLIENDQKMNIQRLKNYHGFAGTPMLTRIILAIILIIGMNTQSSAQSDTSSALSLEPDSLLGKVLNKAIYATYSDSFTTAFACLDSVINTDHECWPAYVFKIGILYTEMNDDENLDRVEYLKALIDTTLIGLDNFLDHSPDDKWALFFKGTTIGYLALYEGHHGSWVKAVFKGLEAGKLFNKAVDEDSTFYDAYLGLGNLNYWRSAKMGFITSLPFIPDRREEGITQITLAMDSSLYGSLPAATGLAWIYYNRKEYSRTAELMNDLEKRGIHGRQILWPKGLAFFKSGSAGGTIETFARIKDGLERKGNQNYYNIGLCNYYLGLSHYWRREYTSALGYFNELLNQQVDSDVAKRLKDKYKAAENYKKKIKKAVAEKSANQ
jgi:tetratricopeptide (TPR) repeat protein